MKSQGTEANLFWCHVSARAHMHIHTLTHIKLVTGQTLHSLMKLCFGGMDLQRNLANILYEPKAQIVLLLQVSAQIPCCF